MTIRLLESAVGRGAPPQTHRPRPTFPAVRQQKIGIEVQEAHETMISMCFEGPNQGNQTHRDGNHFGNMGDWCRLVSFSAPVRRARRFSGTWPVCRPPEEPAATATWPNWRVSKTHRSQSWTCLQKSPAITLSKKCAPQGWIHQLSHCGCPPSCFAWTLAHLGSLMIQEWDMRRDDQTPSTEVGDFVP
jgi:hypothetical protein